MDEAAFESPPDVGHRNIVPAQFHALTDAGHSLSRTGKPEVMQLNFVTEFSRPLKKPDISFAAQSTFQRESLVVMKTIVNLFEQ